MNRPHIPHARGLVLLLMTVLPDLVFPGDWDQIQKFVAADRAELARFGTAVCVDGDYAIVGAFLERTDASGGDTLYAAGAAYIFIRVGGTWVQQQKLVASDRHAQAGFGYAVSISGGYAIVGALYEPYNAVNRDSVFRAGAAYFFERDGSTWTHVQKVVAPDRKKDDHYGVSVGISGRYAIVGAFQQDLNAGGGSSLSDAGAAYIFLNLDTAWVLQQKVVASNRAVGDNFGWSVSLSGDHAVVGVPYKNVGGYSDAGAAYLFSRVDSGWVESTEIVAYDTAASATFGRSVSLSGDYLAVGAPREHYDTSGHIVPLAGAAYLFVKSDTNWISQQKIFAPHRTQAAGFGYAISISGDHAIVGCETWEAHVFTRSGSAWTEQRKLVASDSLQTDDFGTAVGICGDCAMVGAPRNWLDPAGGNILNEAGAVYVFGPGSTGVGDRASGYAPRAYHLNQNFPNPFNPATTITFELPQASEVRLSLFDLLGREITVILNERRSAGVHETRLDASSLASGVYFYRLQAFPPSVRESGAGTFIQTRKLMVVR